jgi:hypothetical protein
VPSRLDLTDHLLAALIRAHLHPPVRVTELLGADRSTVANAITRAGKLLSAILPPPAAPPPGIPLKTLADLNEYAAGHGITLDCAPGTAHTPATMTR